jgi:hypothetical protein
MTGKPTKEELRQKHGTPAEFEAAVIRAANDLFCTDDEARAAIAKYRAEYEAAPSDRTPRAKDGER